VTISKPYPPNAGKIGVAYLRQLVPTLSNSIATSLPELVTETRKGWPDGLFITVNDLNGGGADVDLPQIRHAYLTLDVYAAFPDNDNPQWGRAAIGAGMVWDTLTLPQPYGAALDLGADYLAARAQAMYAISEPRKVEDDPSAYARYTFDAQLDWIALPARFADL
jgi:hypothetical protein